jgi:A/G-specific adenine glycosylase
MTSTLASAGITPSRVSSIRRALVAWHDAEGQDFPWRHARNPYWALVAGVCSQQTQMSRVLPLWERWIAAFPNLDACAATERATVLRVWAGAGYPRRALALRAAARVCIAQHGGELPRNPEALLALPGVGPFTAAVVRCFGFADDAAAVDTNVVRVLGRLVLGDVQPALESARGDIDAAAARLLPRGDAGRWNAALMDYGARVCTPRPRCDACVVRRQCAARTHFEAGAVATPVRAQPRFEGSDRQRRGRILRALRASDGPIRTSTLLQEVARDADELTTTRRLLRALCVDGLAWSRGGLCGLGEEPV